MKKTIKNIELKFLVGEEVYYVGQKSTPHYHKCPSCLGEGKLFRTDKSPITCPKCKGEKELSDSGSITPTIEKDIIRQIRITVDEDRISFEYDLDGRPGWLYAGLYTTEEEARKNLPTYVAGYGTT
jgi:DnaJ-class molecular chaperone